MENKQKRSGKHERQVQELRRSNAAGVHGDTSYNRRIKYRPDYVQEAIDDGLFDEEYDD